MRIARSVLLGIALSLVALPAFADGFLKIDGIKGESKDKGHEGEIEILSFSARGRDFHFVKKIDKASPILAKEAGGGHPISSVEVVYDKKNTSPKNPKDSHVYLKVKLEEVIVTSVSRTSSGDEDVAMAAKAFALTSQTVNPDGSLGPAEKRAPGDFPDLFH